MKGTVSAFSLAVQKGRPEADEPKSALSLLTTCTVLPLPMFHPSRALWASLHSVSEIPVLSHIFGGHFPGLRITRRQTDFLGQCAACSGSTAVREMPPGNSPTTPMVGCMGVGCNGIALQWPDLKGGHIQLHLIQTCGEHLSVGVG